MNQEKIKQVAEKKEMRSKEVASLWMAQKVSPKVISKQLSTNNT